MSAVDPNPRLARRLGVGDAVVLGLGSMIGAGVFAAIGPATAAAGTGVLVALGIAAVVAYLNATSSAQLAALYPESGGTYVYGRERLGAYWGFLAGWGFVAGKTASCAAMALTFGAYVAPDAARPLAVGALVALTVVNLRGIQRTAQVTRVLVTLVLAALAALVAASLFGGQASTDNLDSLWVGGLDGILQAAGLMFFAFAGYARIATLGEEVIDPERTIPRAIPLALGIALFVYAAVTISALVAVGAEPLATSEAPLATAAEAGSLDWLAPAVQVGGALAALSVLLSMIAGVSRTALAMARKSDLPATLAAVHPDHRVPHHAEVAVAAVAVAAVIVGDLREVIGFSAFTILVYYSVTNAASWTLPREQRHWPRVYSACGLIGCVILAATLPAISVALGLGVLAIGSLVRLLVAGRDNHTAQ